MLFKRCARQKVNLGVFAKVATEFYRDIRCGILHQAETTNGWRIRQDGCLFNQNEKIINAYQFRKELKHALTIYCEELKTSKWNDKVWCDLRRKMCEVIKNCIPTS